MTTPPPKKQQDFSDNPELNRLIEEFKRVYESLSPEEKAAFQRKNAIDFAYGNLTCTGRRPYITREAVEAACDERHPCSSTKSTTK